MRERGEADVCRSVKPARALSKSWLAIEETLQPMAK